MMEMKRIEANPVISTLYYNVWSTYGIRQSACHRPAYLTPRWFRHLRVNIYIYIIQNPVKGASVSSLTLES